MKKKFVTRKQADSSAGDDQLGDAKVLSSSKGAHNDGDKKKSVVAARGAAVVVSHEPQSEEMRQKKAQEQVMEMFVKELKGKVVSSEVSFKKSEDTKALKIDEVIFNRAQKKQTHKLGVAPKQQPQKIESFKIVMDMHRETLADQMKRLHTPIKMISSK